MVYLAFCRCLNGRSCGLVGHPVEGRVAVVAQVGPLLARASWGHPLGRRKGGRAPVCCSPCAKCARWHARLAERVDRGCHAITRHCAACGTRGCERPCVAAYSNLASLTFAARFVHTSTASGMRCCPCHQCHLARRKLQASSAARSSLPTLLIPTASCSSTTRRCAPTLLLPGASRVTTWMSS